MSLHLVNTRRVYGTQDRHGLASHLRYGHDSLRVTNVRAQYFVELLLGLLHSQPANMDAPRWRHLYVAVAVDADWFVRHLSQFRPGNIQRVIRSQQISGAYLIVALRSGLGRFWGRASLRGSTRDYEEDCQANRDDSRCNHFRACRNRHNFEPQPELGTATEWRPLEAITAPAFSNAGIGLRSFCALTDQESCTFST